MKKVLSVILVFVIVLGMLPVTALADCVEESVAETPEAIEETAETSELEEAAPEESVDTTEEVTL